MTIDKANKSSHRAAPGDIPLFIVGGPAGCGKSTVGHAISSFANFPFIEGDDLHPQSNIAKMSGGHPLVDADRWEWLDHIISTSRDLESSQRPSGIVVTCSSLKKVYRDRMRKRIDEFRKVGSKLREWFIFCNLTKEESLRRTEARQGHYMKANMVESQFLDLEVPVPGEEERVFVLNVERRKEDVNHDAIEFVKGCLSEEGQEEERDVEQEVSALRV